MLISEIGKWRFVNQWDYDRWFPSSPTCMGCGQYTLPSSFDQYIYSYSYRAMWRERELQTKRWLMEDGKLILNESVLLLSAWKIERRRLGGKNALLFQEATFSLYWENLKSLFCYRAFLFLFLFFFLFPSCARAFAFCYFCSRYYKKNGNQIFFFFFIIYHGVLLAFEAALH